MYFAIFKGEYVPWLADSMEYTDDTFTALEIKINPMAKVERRRARSRAKDVKFTFDGQLNNSKLPYNAHFTQFVQIHRDRRRPDREGELQGPGSALQVRSADRKVRHRYSDRSRALPVQAA